MSRITGKYEKTSVTGEEVSAFVPYPLPPSDPPLELGGETRELLRQAEKALSRLDLAGELVPSIDWFLYAFVRKEAVLSSQIEGTQATLADLLTFEATDRVQPALEADVEEVCNYLRAVSYARAELRREGGLPLSMRLLNETHRRLMEGARGESKQPGEVRRSQNWIGGTRPGNALFVPPPPDSLTRVLSELEKYIHAKDDTPALVRAGLVHVQFETIHPYLDGNGRIGRLLVTLLLEHWSLLPEPLLYLSLYFRTHRSEYYRRLAAVRAEGDWEGWTRFFLEGVASVADEVVATARDLFAIVTADRSRVLESTPSSINAMRLFELLPRHPIVTVGRVTELLETTKPTASKAVRDLVEAGVLVERTGRKRDRAFGYGAYLERLQVEAEG